jgi:hypothetical protein
VISDKKTSSYHSSLITHTSWERSTTTVPTKNTKIIPGSFEEFEVGVSHGGQEQEQQAGYHDALVFGCLVGQLHVAESMNRVG